MKLHTNSVIVLTQIYAHLGTCTHKRLHTLLNMVRPDLKGEKQLLIHTQAKHTYLNMIKHILKREKQNYKP